MTAAQTSRMLEIVRELNGCKTHPSPFIRQSVEQFTTADIERAKEIITKATEIGDGYLAHRVIGAWHQDGTKGVLAYCREKQTA